MIPALTEAVLAGPKWLRTAATIGAALLAIALLSGLCVGAWKLLDWVNDREAVADHETTVRADVTQAQLQAERRAHRHDEARRAAREARTAALRQSREEAIREEDTGVVAGPAVRAVMRELRAQADQDRRPAP